MTKVFEGSVLLMVALVTTAFRAVVEFNAGSGDTTSSIGIAQVAGAIGDEISVDTVGVYEFTCATADAVVVGDDLYWDGTELTVVATANTYAGKSWSAKAGAVAGTAQVKIG